MARALYRTYRPQKLSEVVGQEHITTALDRALKNGTISHAYLFTGPRGVGKTSIARILAHEVNSLPYEDDRQHLDIIEIDAASNRRIDEIRDLRDKVHIAPTSAKYKVYIIDEVHMLTKEAFNALLKTLEEPPAHVVFILATTEVHKLPETIISRTQRYAFKPVDLPKVAEHLKSLAQSEHITIDDDALALIAAHGDGSFRDSISLLDQVRNSSDTVRLSDVQATLGIAPKELIEQLIAAVAAHDAAAVVRELHTLHVGGHDPAQVAKQLGSALRKSLLEGNPVLPSPLLLQLLSKLIEVPASGTPRAHIEIALLDAALAHAPLSGTASPPEPSLKQTPGKSAATTSTANDTRHSKSDEKPKVAAEAIQSKTAVHVEPHPATFRKTVQHPTDPEPESPEPASDVILSGDTWPAILAATKARHNTLFSIVRTVKPYFTAGKVTLECGYAFHQKRLQDARNRQAMAEVIQSVTGETLQVHVTLGEGQNPNDLPQAGPAVLPPDDGEIVHTVSSPTPMPQTTAATPAPATDVPAADPVVSTISNIFGGAEVLES